MLYISLAVDAGASTLRTCDRFTAFREADINTNDLGAFDFVFVHGDEGLAVYTNNSPLAFDHAFAFRSNPL